MHPCIYNCDWILKTDRNVTLGLFHFIDPADSYTHTLPVHCCINRLSWLVCFSRAGFADHVKSRLRQWGSWRALHGRYGSVIYLVLVRNLLGDLGLSIGLWLALLGLISIQNSTIGRYNLPPTAHPPTLITHPTPSCPSTSLYVQSMILQWLWKSYWKSSGVSYIASY